MPALDSPSSIHPPFGNYAHGFEIPAGSRLLTTSGQLGISKNGAIPKEAQAQAELCFDAIEAILAEGGMGLENIVHLRAFVTAREFFQPYMAVRERRLGGRTVASTLVIVGGFTRPEFLVEIEALAAAPVAG
ncbi:RidA family protein [Mangrovimicrobium sediminis]|uniref:RidA family protein n=1 Tax=Mangrovimicrobium sediminis TaxID=2562682 RepID=A0A4Z0M568_9GAMM|nr:RidA family protein [Haliea sp. SAOS-164]TGD74586.1 RidA family protein [Haliea sp. SAOS-164]